VHPAALTSLLNRICDEIRWKSTGIEINTGSSLTNCHHGQNRLDLGKINLTYYHLKIELDDEKRRHVKTTHSPFPLTGTDGSVGLKSVRNSSFQPLLLCSKVYPLHGLQSFRVESFSTPV